jgi:hypothetical protein
VASGRSRAPLSIVARAYGVASLVGTMAVFCVATTAQAQEQSPVPSPMVMPAVGMPVPADCTIVGQAEVADILGFPVEPADASSQAGGICFFTSRAISQDGSVTYAIVTAVNLPQRRAFAAAQARRCAGVVKNAPNAVVCRTYSDVALAIDLDAYFKARTSATEATLVPELGPGAIAAPNAVYVRGRSYVIEAVVRRGETLDVRRATALAKLLIERTAR